MQYINGMTETKRCIPRVVNPGSIFARVSSVLTTSSLFIYNCRHLSIKFWTYRSFLNKSRGQRNRLASLNYSTKNSIHKTQEASGRVENYRKLVKCFSKQWYSYKLNILAWNLFAIIAWSSWTRVCNRSISCVIVWLFTLGLMRSLSWWL